MPAKLRACWSHTLLLELQHGAHRQFVSVQQPKALPLFLNSDSSFFGTCQHSVSALRFGTLPRVRRLQLEKSGDPIPAQSVAR
jgi:hypothetical protein